MTYTGLTKLKGLIKTGRSVEEKSIKGGMWIGITRFITGGIDVLKLLILAHFLAPKEFGLLGIGLLSIGILEHFSKTGFDDALIQKNKNIKQYLDTAWVVQVLRGTLIFIFLFFLSPLIASFFQSPESVLIIKSIAIIAFIRGLTNIGIVYFRKELNYNKEFIYLTGGVLTDLLVVVTFAILWGNVWALVLGLIANNFVSLILSYILSPIRPGLGFDMKKAKELFTFGKNITMTTIIKFIILYGDDIFIGKLLGTVSLGFYRIAYKIGNTSATEMLNVISNVTFSAYSKLQQEIHKLRKAFILVTKFASLLIFPLSVLIIILIKDFISIFLGSEWLPITKTVQILTILGMLKCIEYDSLLKAVGKPEINVKISSIRLCLIIIIIYPLTLKMGTAGTALSVLLGTLAIQPISIYHVSKITKIGIMDFMKILLFPALGSGLMGISLFLLRNTIADISLIDLISLSSCAIIIYIIYIIIFNRIFNYKIMDIINIFRRGIKI